MDAGQSNIKMAAMLNALTIPWHTNITDLPHDTDFPYVIRIIDDLRVIRPYHILIRICLKYTENPYTAHTKLITVKNRRFKINLPTTATENIRFWRILAEPGGICIVRQMRKSILETANESIPLKCNWST